MARARQHGASRRRGGINAIFLAMIVPTGFPLNRRMRRLRARGKLMFADEVGRGNVGGGGNSGKSDLSSDPREYASTMEKIRAAFTPEAELHWRGYWRWKKGYAISAAKYFYFAAERGYANAQYHLGLLYYTGKGVKQSHAKAAEWWRKAAEQGNADAQNHLGMLYAAGEGVEQNQVEAVKWYRKTAEQ